MQQVILEKEDLSKSEKSIDNEKGGQKIHITEKMQKKKHIEDLINEVEEMNIEKAMFVLNQARNLKS